jgi:hypothetical protein
MADDFSRLVDRSEHGVEDVDLSFLLRSQSSRRGVAALIIFCRAAPRLFSRAAPYLRN